MYNDKTLFNYSYLRGFIKDKFGSEKEFANFLNITPQALNRKLNNKSSFTVEQIIKCKNELALSSSQVEMFFFRD